MTYDSTWQKAQATSYIIRNWSFIKTLSRALNLVIGRRKLMLNTLTRVPYCFRYLLWISSIILSQQLLAYSNCYFLEYNVLIHSPDGQIWPDLKLRIRSFSWISHVCTFPRTESSSMGFSGYKYSIEWEVEQLDLAHMGCQQHEMED